MARNSHIEHADIARNVRHGALAAIAGVCIAALGCGMIATPSGNGSSTGNVIAADLTAAASSASLGGVSGTADTSDLPTSIDDSIPDSAILVSPDLVVTEDGEMLDVHTGEPVTDSTVAGTGDSQPDPLAKTQGKHYTQMSVEEAREAMATASSSSASSAEGVSADGSIVAQNTALQNNSYGAYWGTYNGAPAMFMRNGTVAVSNAKGVIDVSQWQKTIDWEAVKRSGVEGAIIRLGFGVENWDSQAARNIRECKRLGIPFGIYWFSYADSPIMAVQEGQTVVNYLKELGVSVSDLSYPIYYDLEAFDPYTERNGVRHYSPTTPQAYTPIVQNFMNYLQGAGYKNTSIYTGCYYAKSKLNSTYLHSLITWIAQYGSRLEYSDWGIATNGVEYKGWQYWSSGSISGISGSVDLNAFSTTTHSAGTMYRLYNPNSGEHFYTASALERGELVYDGWINEGIGWVAPTSSSTPVYRLYNPIAGDHHYTMSTQERDALMKVGWRSEGTGWYSVDGNKGLPLYREYNPNARTGTHNYTLSSAENAQLIQKGWRGEGIAWYALRAS